MARTPSRKQRPRKNPADVFLFLNIPYDRQFEKLCLAYIAGITAFGFVPRATLEIPGGTRRLNRIFDLIRSCPFSIHDLSRVELDLHRPRTPRFNMPFELGLAVAWEFAADTSHTWFVCETRKRRLSKSLSDLDGTDPYIHGGSVRGVFRELGNAFIRSGKQPTIRQMWRVYRDVCSKLQEILKASGARSIFEARAFKDICVIASYSADRTVN